MIEEKLTKATVLANVTINDEFVGEIQKLDILNVYGQTHVEFCFAPEYLTPYGSRGSKDLKEVLDHMNEMFSEETECEEDSLSVSVDFMDVSINNSINNATVSYRYTIPSCNALTN